MMEKKILLDVNDALTRILEDDDVCPALTPRLYSKAQQLTIEKDEMDHKTMKNTMRKYLTRWHTSTKRWMSKNVEKLIKSVADKRLMT